MDKQQAEREMHRLQANREELVDRLVRAIPEDGTVEPLKGVHLFRTSSPTAPVYGVSKPAFCVIAQGSKEVLLGEDRYRYDPSHYLIATVELPVVGQVTEASPELPYLSLRFDLDPALVGSVMVEAGYPIRRSRSDIKAMDVSSLDNGLLDAVVRLVRLKDSPADARVLAPMVAREIIYRLLMGEQGGRLQHIAVLGGYADGVSQVIERLRSNFDKPMRIEHLAREIGMSVSSFHHHFKAVTAMSPLEFQKQLRLQEARRLMLGEGLDAANAGFRVGYGDASHFTRDYKRRFGEPPMRDVARLREAVLETTSL